MSSQSDTMQDIIFLQELTKAKRDKQEPQRTLYAMNALQRKGLKPIWCPAIKAIKFSYKGNEVTFYPYKGWFSGKGVKSGRGIENLLKQLD